VSEPQSSLPAVVVVLGPRADEAVVDHTLRVLNHYGIPFTQVNWPDFSNFLASSASDRLQVIVFETGVAYTDEHLGLTEDVVVPGLLVRTASGPSPGELPTSTQLLETMGYGVEGAVKAGLKAAVILATNDTALRDRIKTNPYPAP